MPISASLLSINVLALGWNTTALAFSGCMTPEQTEQCNFNMAIDYLQDGYNELDAVSDDFNKGADRAAEWHFNKAVNDFEQAIDYFQKLRLDPNQQEAMKDLHVAITSLELCVKSLDKGNDGQAQKYYEQAIEAFTKVAALMD